MRIGIDVRYLSHGLIGGVNSYVANFVPALIRLATEHEIYLYADRKRPLELGTLPQNVVVRRLPWHGAVYSIYNDLFMWRQMTLDGLDAAHFPANYGFGPADVPIVVTLHDAINILPFQEILRGHRKTPKTVAMMTYLHFATLASLRRTALVLTVSEYAKGEILRRGRIEPDRVVPVHHGLSKDLRRVEERSTLTEVQQRFGLKRRIVLADALKNPVVLIRAWSLLPPEVRDGAEIVFFSRTASPVQIVFDAVKAGDAKLLVRPSREELIALYSLAAVFVFPSWIEGFGIPVLEAMACGAPVIASDRGAIPEITGGAALLLDAEDERSLAAHIASVLTAPDEANRLRALGREQASRFSWDKCATEILRCYRVAIDQVEHRRRLASCSR